MSDFGNHYFGIKHLSWQILTSQYKSLYLQTFCTEAFTRGDGTTIFSRTTTSKQPGDWTNRGLAEGRQSRSKSFHLLLLFFSRWNYTDTYMWAQGWKRKPRCMPQLWLHPFFYQTEAWVDPMLRSSRCTVKRSPSSPCLQRTNCLANAQILHSFIPQHTESV